MSTAATTTERATDRLRPVAPRRLGAVLAPRRAAAAAQRAVGVADVRLAGDAEDQARAGAAVRRDGVPDHHDADVHVPLRRRAGRLDRREYLQFLLPGIMVTSVVMITMYTGVGAQHRHREGRLRPVPHAAGLAAGGRWSADLSATCSATSLAAAGDPRRRPGPGLPPRRRRRSACSPGSALLVVFSFAFSWVWTMFGLLLRTREVGDGRQHDGAVPADLPEQRLRRPEHDAGLAAGVRRTSTRSPTWSTRGPLG